MTEVLRLHESEPLDLDATLGCGQAFRWRRDNRFWTGIVADRFIRLGQRGRLLRYSGADEPFIRHYLALDLDLDRILREIDRDPLINRVIDRYRGLRILRQPLFECLLSFLCATNTNIPAVRSRVEAIAGAFGEPVRRRGDARSFPAAASLLAATEADFRACHLGYRARFACSAVAAICSDTSWEAELPLRSHDEARRWLLALPGIGPKAADCVLLYALGHLDAFPVDVWIRRIIARHYQLALGDGPLSLHQYEAVRNFGRDRFGPFAGYAQLYLFNARNALCRV